MTELNQQKNRWKLFNQGHATSINNSHVDAVSLWNGLKEVEDNLNATTMGQEHIN